MYDARTPRRTRALARASATVLLVAAGIGLTATGSRAAPKASRPICVAVVVDARSIGANVSIGCAKVHQGATGIDVLQAAGHSVTFRSDGLLCTIDGLPRTGCSAVDDTHFWAYYHRAPGSTAWSYSSAGPATYTPVNDSTDGWVYDDGTKLTPENVAYSKICPPEKKSPKPAPASTHPTSSPHLPTTKPHPFGSPSPSPTVRPRPTRQGSPLRPTPSVSPLATSPATAPQHPPTRSPSSTLTSSGGGGHGGLFGAIVAAVLVAGIGGATVVVARRRRT
jgi:hypothetical protein